MRKVSAAMRPSATFNRALESLKHSQGGHCPSKRLDGGRSPPYHYRPDMRKVSAAMRPSATFNRALESLRHP